MTIITHLIKNLLQCAKNVTTGWGRLCLPYVKEWTVFLPSKKLKEVVAIGERAQS